MMEVKKLKAREILVILLGGALYAILYALGSQIDQVGKTQLGTSLLRFAYAMPVAVIAFYAIFRYALPRLEMKPDTAQKRPFCTVGAWVLIFACYVPMFLIQYPGTFMYDTQAQTFQIAGNAYNAHHPLLHTLLIRFCLSLYGVLQSFELCAAVYSLIQMVVVSGCFALFCASLSRSVSRGAAYIALAFFCLYPTHMAFACNCIKDVLFSGFFALYMALCFEEMHAGGLGRGRRALQIAAGVLSCLLRNNMVYAMAVWAVFLLLRGRRFWRCALCVLMMIVLSHGVNAGLKLATKACDGSVREMLSVPIQQIARAWTHAPEAFDEAQAAYLQALMPKAADYEPTLSDPVKNHVDEAVLKADPAAFAKLWLSVGAKCPGEYVDAFVSLALPALYPYSAYTVVQPYIETGLHYGVLTAPFGQRPMTQPGRFEALRDWMNTHIFETGADDVLVIRWLFNTGAIYWLLLLLLLYDMYRGDWQRVGLLLLPVLLYGTYLLGPVMQARYSYPFICCLPLFIFRAAQRDCKFNA